MEADRPQEDRAENQAKSSEKLARAAVKKDQRHSKRARGRKEKEKKATRLEKPPARTVDENFGLLVKSCRKAQVAVDQPVALICQAQRSGGTLLRNLFDGHPQCHVHPYEWHCGHSRRFHWPKLPLEDPPERWWVKLREDALDRRFQSGVRVDPTKYRGEDAPERREIYPFLLPPLLHRELFIERINDIRNERELAGDRDILDAYMTGLFNGWLNNQTLREPDKRWVVAFAPRLAWGERREQFFGAYPDGQMIAIVRSPQTWLASGRGRQIKGAENTERLMEVWKESTRETIAAKEERPDRVTVVRFDDLIRDVRGVMGILAAKLGIEYTDLLTEPTFNSQPIGANSSYSTATAGVVAAPLKSHKKVLSEEDEELIAEQCDQLYQDAKKLASRPPKKKPEDQASVSP